MTDGFPKFIRNLAAQVNAAAQVALRGAQRADGSVAVSPRSPARWRHFSCCPFFLVNVNCIFKQRNGAARLSAQGVGVGEYVESPCLASSSFKRGGLSSPSRNKARKSSIRS